MEDSNPAKLFLLPNKFKIVGGIFLSIGIILAVFRFYYGIKPDFLHVSVFSIYSTFLETNYFSMIKNNISEEIVGLLILFGLCFMAFSKEKNENGAIQSIRLNVMFLSVIVNLALVGFTFLFVYGLAFAKIMVINLYSVLIIYIILFKVQLYANSQKNFL